jgi:hypothetical protein
VVQERHVTAVPHHHHNVIARGIRISSCAVMTSKCSPSHPPIEHGLICFVVCCRGKDIGSSLMKHIVQGSSANIYLTTLRKTIRFYEAAGFQLLQASEVPW